MVFTDLNLEQSVARYLANQFLAASYSVYWWDTKQTEGTGTTISFVRDIPADPVFLVRYSEPQQDHLIRVPCIAVTTPVSPKTDDTNRMGIGEQAFQWSAYCRVEAFADTEPQWYALTSLLQSWLMHPDVRISVANYQADLTNAVPTIVTEKIQFSETMLAKKELGKSVTMPEASRYYIAFSASAKFVE